MPYIDVEVERLVNNIVKSAVNDEMKNINLKEILILDYDCISYDAIKINEIETTIDKRIQNELINIDDGKIDDFFIPNRIKKGRFKKIKNGILCDVSIGSIRGSTLFSNIGPSIPIKLLFSSQINSNIDVDTNEYGINNAIVKIYLNLDIKSQVTMPLSSKRKKISINKPIIIDIIKGKIPDYYTGLTR